jgi:hypothetical protein
MDCYNWVAKANIFFSNSFPPPCAQKNDAHVQRVIYNNEDAGINDENDFMYRILYIITIAVPVQ